MPSTEADGVRFDFVSFAREEVVREESESQIAIVRSFCTDTQLEDWFGARVSSCTKALAMLSCWSAFLRNPSVVK